MSARRLRPQALTREAFAPYGEVIIADAGSEHFTINYGQTERYHQLATVDVADSDGAPIISLFRSTPLSQPVTIRIMERHPLGSQAFYPLSPRPYLVVVAPPGDFDAEKVEAFLAQPGQGVNYHKGVWHHYCLALDDVSDFLVVDRKGPGNNCDEIELPGAPWTIDL
ncbi:ureidoglycolate lyase [Hahella aquimaris]|uniref:ureidoglycolate lyase n=1 Tax=Hahella sp. HNIBRBA332 TaxID=3015983 RepID=UPI00273A8588|nr:ureidoglycolate lyase [Hahella sp. HNIBRBA332]WLQ12177.1 ureidoglycolate lyase [Hahella sp. HNIBRBA332]